ncbi:MAG: antitoxin CcdA [Sphingomonadales bacterium]|nr:antitoxin CcdA [Sphingomonadales bacterium]MEA3042932.1 antitoxin CcdA [Sphingomonadales bacterium]
MALNPLASAVKPVRRATNISLNTGILAEAKALGINVSRACEGGLEAEIARIRRESWLAENKSALESSNAFAETNGLPLAALRQF